MCMIDADVVACALYFSLERVVDLPFDLRLCIVTLK